jgi:hypothetical protein
MNYNSRIVALLLTVIFFARCSSNNNSNEGSKVSDQKQNAGRFERELLTKFALPYSTDFIVDSNALIFYCARNFDTSSLIHIQYIKPEIKGIYYQVLPTYHQNVNDFATEENNLLFFEGYSFVLDSSTWLQVKNRAVVILGMKDSLTKADKYIDDTKYGLLHNSQALYGDGNYEDLYSEFDSFLKRKFLQKIIYSRKPTMKKVK